MKKNIFNLIEKKIKNFKKIIILGHLNPDGDSIGTQIGLQNLLQLNYKNKKIIISVDYSIIPNLNFLNPKTQNLNQKDFNESLIILVDVQDVMRTEYKNFKFKNFIIIDHHKKIKKNNSKLEWIDEKYPATAQMITILAKKLKWNFNEKAATALLTGIITDTGNFKYNLVNHKTFEISSFLMKKDANLQIIHKNINKITNNDIKILNYIYKKLIFENKLIYFIFKPENKKDLPFIKKYIEIKKFIGNLNFIEKNLVRVFFIQWNKEEKINCSLRSSDDFNVRNIANKFKGGGHINASGIKLQNWKQVNEVLNEIKKNLKI